MTVFPEQFVEAEIAYRVERARSRGPRPKRHRVPRRHSLRLPRYRRRPVAVA